MTLLNFTVNAAGLEDQLLGLVVGKERPELQDAKNQLVVSMAAMRKTQKDLEDKILKLLAESEGDILDDESLINVLGEAKVTSDDISVKVQEAEKTEKEIDETRERCSVTHAPSRIYYVSLYRYTYTYTYRERYRYIYIHIYVHIVYMCVCIYVYTYIYTHTHFIYNIHITNVDRYRPTAFRGSLLFFCVSDLARVDPMYQYSLQWFLGLFEAGLDNSDKHEDVEVLPSSHSCMGDMYHV